MGTLQEFPERHRAFVAHSRRISARVTNTAFRPAPVPTVPTQRCPAQDLQRQSSSALTRLEFIGKSVAKACPAISAICCLHDRRRYEPVKLPELI